MRQGSMIGKYRIEEHLGSGGMAEVYRAYQPSLDRYVAIKILHRFLAIQEDFLSRFRREARVVAMLRHPNIVQVYDFDFDQDDDVYYMVMEYIDGPTLKDRLEEQANRGKALPLGEAVRIVVAVADALAYAHRRGMVHRDIKPANIMFNKEGQVILTDFGIAKIVNATGLTASGTMVGTPAYMAPEQGMGQAGDERADIYSLGAVLYQLTTGRLPYDAETLMGVVLKHINEPLTPPIEIDPDFPSDIEAVILRAMEKDLDRRTQSASLLAADLRAALADLPSSLLQTEGALLAPAQPADQPTPPSTPLPASAPLASNAATAIGTSKPGGPRGPAGQATQVSPAEPGRPQRKLWPLWLGGGAAIIAVALALWFFGLPQRLLAGLSAAVPALQPTETPTATLAFTATPKPSATPTDTPSPTASPSATSTPSPSATPTATPTPDRTATWVAACVYDLRVIEDPPVWPPILMPGQQFVKRWTIENSGSCPWPVPVRLTLVDGDESRLVETPDVPQLAPEEQAEIEIVMRAPSAYASYADTWQVQGTDETTIGEPLVVSYQVNDTPTPRPTATDTPTPTPEASPTPQEPLHFSVPVLVGWEDIDGNQWRGTVGLTAWGGTGEYQYYVNGIAPENEFFNGSFDFQAQRCRGWVGTIIVVSGDEEQRWQGVFNYPGGGCP